MVRRLNRFTERAFAMVADTVATLVTDNDVHIPDVEGIFDNALVPKEVGKDGTAQGGTLTLNRRQKIFTAPSSACVGVNVKWRVLIAGKSYHVADHHPDGQGFMTLWLADSPRDSTVSEVTGDGPKWR